MKVSSPDTHSIPWAAFLNRPVFTHRPLVCNALLSGKTVLVTGAGGSIGSVVAVLLMGALARRLILLDRSECGLHNLYRKYKEMNVVFPSVEFIQADILDERLIHNTFAKHRPEIIFHAAALKHLPQLESDPLGALENNVLGTIRVLQIADWYDVQHLVNVSTDKAVNPTSILGVSKRISELLLLAADQAMLCTRSLRLGNVLESSGSVVPAIVHSLKNRGQVTITDPEASRYFITLDEAAAFLIETLNVKETALLVPEMGCPRTLLELLAFLMQEFRGDLSDDDIVHIGLRDGEKKVEQLIYDYERYRKTLVPHLYQIEGTSITDFDGFAENVGRILDLVADCQCAGLVSVLQDIVPEFQPSATVLRCLS